MKKDILSVLVVIITFITIVSMSTLHKNTTYEVNKISSEETMETEKTYDGTGYIFDYDQQLNIPIIDKQSKLQDTKEKVGAFNDKKAPDFSLGGNFKGSRYKIICIKENDYVFKEKENTETVSSYYNISNQKEISQNKTKVEKVKNNITFSDKLELVKMAKNLSIDDILKLKKAIDSGTTNKEENEIFKYLRTKLDEDEYKKVLIIINKYAE